MMTIMTLNLNFDEPKHGAWPVRKELIVDAMRRHTPDLVALQAVRKDETREGGKDQATQLAERLPQFRYVAFETAHRHADGRHDGSAFLSRIPFNHVEHFVLSLGAMADQAEDPATRIILFARVASPDLALFNSHYSWIEAQATSNLTEALHYMRRASAPGLLLGDLNATPDSHVIRRLWMEGWTDVWAYLRPDDPGYTFESNAPDKRIDYVWVQRELLPSVKTIDVVKEHPNADGARLSDHLGLVVTLA